MSGQSPTRDEEDALHMALRSMGVPHSGSVTVAITKLIKAMIDAKRAEGSTPGPAAVLALAQGLDLDLHGASIRPPAPRFEGETDYVYRQRIEFAHEVDARRAEEKPPDVRPPVSGSRSG